MKAARAILVVAVGVTLAGCGGEGSPPSSVPSAAPPLATGGGGGGTSPDLDAQKLLRAARTTALTYYVNHARTYVGFDAAYANDLDPSIVFSTGEPAAGQVTIRERTRDTILFVTIGASGTPLCIGESEGRAGETSTGLVDASTLSYCAGGWSTA
jgi:hypothetical protein